MIDEEKRMKKGKVYLIGAGPGDPELFTLKGKRCLEKADVIVGDYLADKRILRFANKNAEYIYVGKSCGSHTMTQQDISRLLAEKGKEGKIVARLKGGDPFVFGRGGEEIEVLRAAGVDFEEVPGVTSAIAAPAYAGIPVTTGRWRHPLPLSRDMRIRQKTILTSIGKNWRALWIRLCFLWV